MSKKYEFSDNIQRGILYLSKTDREYFVQTSHMIEPVYFSTDVQTAIYQAISDYFETYRKLPSDGLILEGVKKLKVSDTVEQDFKTELALVNGIQKESLKHKEAYLDLTEKFARESAVRESIVRSIELLEQDNIEAIEDEVKKALKVGRHADMGLGYKEKPVDRYTRFYDQQVEQDRFPLGFPKLDGPLHGGMCKKELGMIVANSGVGKSLFLCRQGLESCRRGKNTLYLTMEMSEDAIMGRLDTMLTRMDYKAIQRDKSTFLMRLQKASDEILKGEFTVKQFPSLLTTPGKIRAFLEYIQNYKEIKYDQILVDYLELLRPSVKDLPEYEAQQRIAQELRGIAVEYDVNIWTATQSNRQGANAAVITETELAGSFGKVREVDYAYSINQTDKERADGEARLYVMKSRNARSKYITPVSIDYKTLQIEEIELDDQTD